MATLPASKTTLSESNTTLAAGQGYLCVMGCVPQSADSVPRIFASQAPLLAQYGYSDAVDYCATHFDEADTPVIFIGLPVATAGTIFGRNNTGVTGTCQITVAAAAAGVFSEVQASVTVTQGVNVGTDQIVFALSLDNGLSTQTVRLGTATTYTIPYVGLVLTFSLGTLNPGDVFTFKTTAPMWGSTAIATAEANLAAQQNGVRSWLTVGDLPNSTFANYVVTSVNNYASVVQRFVYARAQVQDRQPLATKSQINFAAVGAGAITFSSSAHTIVRTTGSFVTDGFAVGQGVTVAGSTSNNGFVGVLTGVVALTLTFASGVVTEGPDASGVSILGAETLTFASSGDTITRSSGSFLNELFAVGDYVTIAGSTSNNGTLGPITALSATVMTFGSGVVSEGPESSAGISMVQSNSIASWITTETAAFATIAGQKRIDLGAGKGTITSPITAWNLRRPVQWAASMREYQHDVQIPCWRKFDGPFDNFSITDTNGNALEYDERVNGGALAGLFTCARSYANGPLGAFIALSLTRDTDGATLSRTQNMAVANLAQTVVQTATENFIGVVLELNANGTGTTASLQLLEKIVNKALQINLLQNFTEGPRASGAVWAASRTDVLNIIGATLNGVLSLNLNGTVEQIATTIVVS